MSETVNYGLFVSDDDQMSFRVWRQQINGTTDSNMVKINAAIAEKPGVILPEAGEIFNDYENNSAPGRNAHSEGEYTTASGVSSHAEGYNTVADGPDSHAEGSESVSNGYGSHAEGRHTIANGMYQHVQGKFNIADSGSAHIIGNGSSDNDRSNAHTVSFSGDAWYAGDVYVGSTSGTNKDEGSIKLATVNELIGKAGSGENSSVFNNYDLNIASGAYSHSEGYGTEAAEMYAHAEGFTSKASGVASHAEGSGAVASGMNAHAEGVGSVASGGASHAEGSNTEASGMFSHAEGQGSIASGDNSHAEGCSTIASTVHSHAEGYNAKASGYAAHAEGEYTTASGSVSHAEGSWTKASGYASHAEGNATEAAGNNSHAQGLGTLASSKSENVIGEYNTSEDPYVLNEEPDSLSFYFDNADFGYEEVQLYIFSSYTTDGILFNGIDAELLNGTKVTPGDYFSYTASESSSIYKCVELNPIFKHYTINNVTDTAHIGFKLNVVKLTLSPLSATDRGHFVHVVGNGTSEDARSNAHTLDWKGNAWFAGDVYVGSTSGTGKDDGSVKLQKEIIGTAGNFVVIGDDGTVITKSADDLDISGSGGSGQRGTGILTVTTEPYVYADDESGFSAFGLPLSTVTEQSGMETVLKGDLLLYQGRLYTVTSIDTTNDFVQTNTTYVELGGTSASVYWGEF